MSEITKDDVEEYCEGEKELSKAEIKVLKAIMDYVEAEEYRDWKHINGGFAEAGIYGYDDEVVNMSLQYGEQDMGGGFSSSSEETFHIDRAILLKKMSLEKKLKTLKWGN